MIKQYKFTHPLFDCLEAVLEVDYDKLAHIKKEDNFDVLNAVNDFFSDKETRNRVHGELAGLSLIAAPVLAMALEGGCTSYITRKFRDGDMEGMPDLDGDYGISLISVFASDIDPEDLDIEEIN